MKSITKIIILLVVIAVLGVGLFFVLKMDEKPQEAAPQVLPQALVVMETDASNVNAITVTREDGAYTLQKQSTGWVCTDNVNLPINQSYVQSLLLNATTLTAEEEMKESLDDLSVYGLSEPSRFVTLSNQDGSETVIYVGANTLDNTFSYITFGDKTKVYTKDIWESENLVPALSSLIDMVIYSVDTEALSAIEIKNMASSETISLQTKNEAKEGEDPKYRWYMKSPIDKVANEYGMGVQLLPYIGGLNASQVITTAEAGVDYGFGAPTYVYSLTLRATGQKLTITVGKSEGGYAYVKSSNSPCIYVVDSMSLDFMKLTYLDLVNKNVYLANIREVSEIKINGFGKTYNFLIDESDTSASYSINGESFNKDAFTPVYSSVVGLVLDGYTSGAAGETVVTIDFTKKDGTKNRVTCHTYDDRSYLVNVDGSGRYLVRKKNIDNMFTQIEKLVG